MYKLFLALTIILAIPNISQAQEPTSLRFTDSLLVELEHTVDLRKKTKIYINLTNFYYRSSFDSSEWYALKALELSSEIDDRDTSHIYVLNTLGQINVLQGDYDVSMEYFLAALRLAEKNKYPLRELLINVNIGALYDRQNNYKEALARYNMALRGIEENTEHFTDSMAHFFKATIFNNLGNVHGYKNDTSRMITYYEMALAENAKIWDMETKGLILNNLGNTHSSYGDPDLGYKYLKEALDLRIFQQNQKGMAQSYRNLGNHFQREKLYDSAILFYEQGLKAARKINSLKEQVDIYNGLYETYELIGNLDSALHHLKFFKLSSDSLYNDSKAVEIARLQNAYEMEKVQAEQALIQREKEMKWLLIFGILLLLILIASIIVINQRNKIRHSILEKDKMVLRHKSLELEKKNLNMELDHKTKELTTNVLYLFKKNELIGNIAADLDEIRSNLKPENVRIINKILKSLDKLIDDNSWKEFETRFNDVHKGFYKTLLDNYPELTPNERKLAAFLKLNMTSKEISSVTGQSVRSIDVARTRLRKKLKLTNSEVNLVDFLNAV